MKPQADIIETVDVKYKDGFVLCAACGWKHDLGDGFNIYHIASCPNCATDLATRDQRKVIYWDKEWHGLRADIGVNRYFILSNGIHVRYQAMIQRTIYGTERELDRL